MKPDEVHEFYITATMCEIVKHNRHIAPIEYLLTDVKNGAQYRRGPDGILHYLPKRKIRWWRKLWNYFYYPTGGLYQ